MEFSDTTNKDGIIQMCEVTTNLGDATISGTAAKLAYFTNLINQWDRLVKRYIWMVDRNWHYDDSNYTTLPVATTTLVNNQRDYTMPTVTKELMKVEIMNSDGNYNEIPFEPLLSSTNRYKWMQEDAGKPERYGLASRSIILDPKVDTTKVTAAAGIRITVAREGDAFTTTDTTQGPGYDNEFHPVLYYGPSMEWAAVNGSPDIYTHCEKMLGFFPGLFDILKDYYGSRNTKSKPVLQNIFTENKFT